MTGHLEKIKVNQTKLTIKNIVPINSVEKRMLLEITKPSPSKALVGITYQTKLVKKNIQLPITQLLSIFTHHLYKGNLKTTYLLNCQDSNQIVLSFNIPG